MVGGGSRVVVGRVVVGRGWAREEVERVVEAMVATVMVVAVMVEEGAAVGRQEERAVAALPAASGIGPSGCSSSSSEAG